MYHGQVTEVSMCRMARMPESVDHPAHYGGADNPYEAIKVIEAMGIAYDFCLGNAVKYLMRARLKGSEAEDLKKARWYIDRAIRLIEDKPPPPPAATMPYVEAIARLGSAGYAWGSGGASGGNGRGSVAAGYGGGSAGNASIHVHDHKPGDTCNPACPAWGH
jgi:hypothetical protein